MRFFLIFLFLFSFIGSAQAEQNYFFSGDSPSIVKNRIKLNLKSRTNKDVDFLSRFNTSFEQNGDTFHLYGTRVSPGFDGSPQQPQLLYTIKVSGSVYNRTFVQVVPAPTKDDHIISNIESFMKGVVEERESSVFTPQWDHNRELSKAIFTAPIMLIEMHESRVKKLNAKIKDVFGEGTVGDGFHEAQVLQVIADTKEMIADNNAVFERYESRGENPIINGVSVKDTVEHAIRLLKRQLASIEQYKKDNFDPVYAESRLRYNKLKTKLNQAYGYGYSSEEMFSGSYCATSDGGSVLAGQTEVNEVKQPLLLKFDKAGELQFHKLLPAYPNGRSLFRSITQVEDDQLVGVVERTKGSDARIFIYKMSARGSLIWEKDFPNIVLNGVVFDPRGFYYAIGRSDDNNSSAFVAKLDTQGNVIYQKLFGTGQGSNSLIDGVVLRDHSLVVVGYGTSAADTSSRAMMLHLSDTGNLLTENFHGTAGSLFFAAAVSADNTILAGGAIKENNINRGVVFKFDLQGHEVWQTVIFERLRDQDSEVYDIKAKGDAAILVGAAMDYGFVAKLNQKGDLVWRDIFGEEDKKDSLKGLCLDQNGKILVAGETNSYASMGGQNLWHFALDDKQGTVFTEKTTSSETAFLSENKTKAGVITLASGAQYKVLREGAGLTPTDKDIVQVHYHGTLIDGSVFDSTYDRRESLEMEVAYFVKGLQELLKKMKVGSKWQLFIPADLAYGEEGRGDRIPPNSTLVYELELLEVKGK